MTRRTFDVSRSRALRLGGVIAAACLMLGAAIAPAHAGTAPACTGRNLVAELERTDPAKLEAARQEAASIKNGQGRFWKVEKPGLETSWLLGTMHVADDRVTDLSQTVWDAFYGVGTMVVETTDIMDQKKMSGILASRPDLIMYTDDTTLFSAMSEADADLLKEKLEARGIPPFSVQKMKPWMIYSALSMPKCQTALIAGGTPVLDAMLAKSAQEAGKEVLGLETGIEQFDAMASLGPDFYVRGMIDILRTGTLVDDVNETMIALYQSGEIGLIMPAIMQAMPATDNSARDLAAFDEKLITTRNHTMAERAAPILANGNVFIAVGALHLPGDDGLVELLRKQGFTVTAVAGH